MEDRQPDSPKEPVRDENTPPVSPDRAGSPSDRPQPGAATTGNDQSARRSSRFSRPERQSPGERRERGQTDSAIPPHDRDGGPRNTNYAQNDRRNQLNTARPNRPGSPTDRSPTDRSPTDRSPTDRSPTDRSPTRPGRHAEQADQTADEPLRDSPQPSANSQPAAIAPRAERQADQSERELRPERPSRRPDREPRADRNEPRPQNRPERTNEGTAVAPRQPRRPERLIANRDPDDQSLPDDGPTDRGATEPAERPVHERLMIGITLGDYNGIGPEVILKALQHNQLQKICTPVIYGSMRVLNRYRNLLDLKDWNLNGIQQVSQASHKLTNVITCFSENSRPAPAPVPPVAPPEPVLSPVADPTAPTADAGTEPALSVKSATATEPGADTPAVVVEAAAPVTAKQVEPAVAGPVVVHDIQPGKVTPEAGRAALACLQRAVEDLKAGKLDAIVTAPINKHNIQSDEFQFPGHTEYLAQAFEVGDNLMFLVSERLRVGVVTGHVPLGRVRGQIHREAILRKLKLMSQSLQGDFGIQKPRIAVLGLNPHAGEEGLLGNEEQEVIKPLIADLQAKGQLVYGPFAADGFFGTGSYRQFDAVLAMYHDQGLIPFKTLAFDEGVNFTAGMPVVRTSPDHGTAYDIAGRNLADETSMIQAIYVACDVARRRKENKELNENALKPKAAR